MILVTANNSTNAGCRHLTSADATKWAALCFAKINKVDDDEAEVLAKEFIGKVEAGNEQSFKNPNSGSIMSFRRI